MTLSEKKRLAILDAAETLFHQQGVEQTSMDQVASEAGVSKRTVYNHFATKQILFQAILTRMFEQLSQGPEKPFNANREITAQLTEIAEQEVALLTSPQLLRIAKIAFMQMLQQPELMQSLDNTDIGCMTALVQFLQDANAAGVLNVEDCDFAARQFVYQLKAFTFYPKLYGFSSLENASEQSVIAETVKMFMARYRAIY
ncbi:TetR/AcrR family transcriptional regulator [Photobacterium halotolerans]|uniref:TetR/AcrR family transcriptional regulator n=1 Tax=Photobacterium halotolerans TaxID=265726 RepID=UPI001372E208|nr:TetR/AcrR family transcriptional regulator [Photobacterium halotolerans]NAW88895.1 TetR family transcriptional regulator [Photobacterium halotolerans]